MPVVVSGLRELNRAFADTSREIRLGWRAEMRQVAEPIRQDAERLAMSSISHMHYSPKWSRMRVGVTRTMVYVAPRQKGTRGRGNPARRRGVGFAHPPFSDLLMDKALEPAGRQHEQETEARVEHLMDKVVAGFNLG